MNITQESWDALMEGQTRDEQRIAKLAAQVERLSWMCEYLSDTGLTLEDALDEWARYSEARRDT
jgi:hypothetical protein